ncbi:STAS domain-containing protein [bacterium]|nr:STAS domain-containing protein [bacterium]MCI0606663.1 STAS domain-containing protein [bacterium]
MSATENEVKTIRVPFERMVYELLDQVSREWAGYLQEGYRYFVMDLGRVAFMDSASIGCLMDFYRKTKAAGGRIHLAAVQPRIDTLLAIAKAKTLFAIYNDVEDAVAAFQREGSDL